MPRHPHQHLPHRQITKCDWSTGWVFTMDALHTAKAITTEFHAHYVLILKGNQPPSRCWQAPASNGPRPPPPRTTADMGAPNAAPSAPRRQTTPSPPTAQVFRLRRDTGGLDSTWTGKEIVYGITGLPTDLAGPVHLNHYERYQWTIENKIHWVRDVTFNEDNSHVRTGTAPRALARARFFLRDEKSLVSALHPR